MTTETRTIFYDAEEGYREALARWEPSVEAYREAQAALRAAEFDLANREAEVLFEISLNWQASSAPDTSPEKPKPRNAEERNAALRISLNYDEPWLRASASAEEARKDVARHQDAAEAAKHEMALHKARMNMEIELTRLAASEGGEA